MALSRRKHYRYDDSEPSLLRALKRLKLASGRGYHRQLQETGIRALVAALDARDNYTGKHSEAVVNLACAVATKVGAPDQVLAQIMQVALLHDIGKIGIPDSILRKPGPLTKREWAVMKKHPAIGGKIVASIPTLSHLARMVRAEHERWDGTGYPDCLQEREIPLASRVTFACDAFHAMISRRPYREAIASDDAMLEIANNLGSQFCPETGEALIEVVTDGFWT